MAKDSNRREFGIFNTELCCQIVTCFGLTLPVPLEWSTMDLLNPMQLPALINRKSSEPRDAVDSESTHLNQHTYHGHRRDSFTTEDIEELTELRARRKCGLIRVKLAPL